MFWFSLAWNGSEASSGKTAGIVYVHPTFLRSKIPEYSFSSFFVAEFDRCCKSGWKIVNVKQVQFEKETLS